MYMPTLAGGRLRSTGRGGGGQRCAHPIIKRGNEGKRREKRGKEGKRGEKRRKRGKGGEKRGKEGKEGEKREKREINRRGKSSARLLPIFQILGIFKTWGIFLARFVSQTTTLRP